MTTFAPILKVYLYFFAHLMPTATRTIRAPRILIANALLVPAWATWDNLRDLEQRGLTMYGQMTAGSWIDIGSQSIVHGTCETLAAVARHADAGYPAAIATAEREGVRLPMREDRAC